MSNWGKTLKIILNYVSNSSELDSFTIKSRKRPKLVSFDILSSFESCSTACFSDLVVCGKGAHFVNTAAILSSIKRLNSSDPPEIYKKQRIKYEKQNFAALLQRHVKVIFGGSGMRSIAPS